MEQHPVKVCAVIPFFNNEATVAQVIRDVRRFIPDVIAVNDGSSDASPQRAAAENPILLTHSVNRGKGAAVKTAARYAMSRQFTHMIQIDADCQHDPEYIPDFKSAIQNDPSAVITGCRKFDKSVPLPSRFGRWFGNLWFRIETLGVPIQDTQCGFRAYPLVLFDTITSRCDRMEFDVEILILAVKSGFMIRNLEVDVRYFTGDDRVTHFNPWTDNWRMSRLHFTETWKLLVHWPMLLQIRKKYKTMSESDIFMRKQ